MADSVFGDMARLIDPDALLQRCWALDGGVSSQMTVLELAGRDGLRRVVVRAHGEIDRARDPDLARHEFALLQVLADSGIGAPRPCLLDTSATLLPTPYLIVEYIDGAPALTPAQPLAAARAMATRLASIHRLDLPAFDWLPDVSDRVAGLLARNGPDEFGARATLQRHWSVPAIQPDLLLHGDFWPGNLLWQADRLVGVIDWEDVAHGNPLADVAITRLELLWLWGERAVDAFTAHYAASTGVDLGVLPLWDLHAVLRPAGRWDVWFPDERKRQHALHCTRAFAERAQAKIDAT